MKTNDYDCSCIAFYYAYLSKYLHFITHSQRVKAVDTSQLDDFRFKK